MQYNKKILPAISASMAPTAGKIVFIRFSMVAEGRPDGDAPSPHPTSSSRRF